MINPNVFAEEMAILGERFGKQLPEVILLRYLDLLDEAMTTEEFEGACRAILYSREFFPKPVDFLAVLADARWPTVATLAQSWSVPVSEETKHLVDQLDPTTRRVLARMGGVSEVREMMARRGWAKAREEYVEVFGRELSSQVLSAYLPTHEPRKRLVPQNPAEDEGPAQVIRAAEIKRLSAKIGSGRTRLTAADAEEPTIPRG